MRQMFWFAVGAGAAVYAVVKVRGVLQQTRPQAIGQRVTGTAIEVGERAHGFADRVRAGMAEREAELRAQLKLPPASSEGLGRAD